MRLEFIVIIAIIVACAGTAEQDSLRCTDCTDEPVIRVIDGDTLDTTRGRVRLFGVDTPEHGERCAAEATDRLQELAGDSVQLEYGPRLTDQFGRATRLRLYREWGQHR